MDEYDRCDHRSDHDGRKNYEISKTNKAMAALSDSLDVKSVIGKNVIKFLLTQIGPVMAV